MTDFNHGERVHPSAALYLLGALDSDAEIAFERHLADCVACQRECDYLGPLASGLSHLGTDELTALLSTDPARPDGPADAPAGPEDGPDARDEGTGPAAPYAGGRPADAGAPRSRGALLVTERRPRRRAVGASPPTVPPARAVTPAPPGAPGRPRPRRVRLVAGVAAVLLALAGGLAVGSRLHSGTAPPARLTPVDRSVTVEGTASSARLSVTMVARPQGTTVVATVSGLEPAVRYRLYAVTMTAETREVAEWAGKRGATELTAELGTPLDDLAFFSVTRTDGTAVVAARLDHRPDPARSSAGR